MCGDTRCARLARCGSDDEHEGKSGDDVLACPWPSAGRTRALSSGHEDEKGELPFFIADNFLREEEESFGGTRSGNLCR